MGKSKPKAEIETSMGWPVGGVGNPPKVRRASAYDALLDDVEEKTAAHEGLWCFWPFETAGVAKAAQQAVTGRLEADEGHYYRTRVVESTLYVRRMLGSKPERKRGGA